MYENMTVCPICGRKVSTRAVTCPGCGHPLYVKVEEEFVENGISEYSWLLTFIFVVFLGALGVHRFYVGKVGTGLLMLFTFGGLGIWTLIDLIMVAVGAFTDSKGQKIKLKL